VILNSFFDRIVLINLDRRADRLELFTEQADAVGLKFERFAAVDAQSEKITGAQACAASHREVVTQAQADGVGRLLIFEDDAVFADNFADKCEVVLAHIPHDWQMFYLGSWPYSIIPVNSLVAKTHGTICTHALGFKSEIFDFVIECSLGPTPIDDQLARRHCEINAYMAQPSIVNQRPGFSDIRNHDVDYVDFIR
jgi:glycosyl transferase family 25